VRESRSDAELVLQALDGAKEPLAELLRRHRDTALFLCSRVLNSPDLAGDAVQEAAIAAMTDLRRLRSPDRFGAWFCGIALNVSRRWLRQLRFEILAVPPDRVSELVGPAEAAEIAELADRVRDAISQLAPGQRDAVLLFYLQGLSHREVAAELGISPGAVKARLHQARAALAPRLADMAAEAGDGVEVTDPVKTSTMKESAMTATDAVQWVDVVVSEVKGTGEPDVLERKHIMVLAERDGERWLPIWIGPAEATALARTLESAEMPRPPTYKLAASLVEAAGASVTEVRLTSLASGVFYAVVLVAGSAGVREVDARPSDAVNLAVATGAPVRLNSELFKVVTPDECEERLPEFSVGSAAIVAEADRHLREALEKSRERQENAEAEAEAGGR
jgi:RNA polymerase sigma factor (sigma-70 family)